jgi:hypothetical protein
MKRIPKVGDRVTLASSSDVWIVDQVSTNPDLAVVRLNHIPEHVKTVPWASLRYLPEDVNQAAARIVREATDTE